MESTRLFDIESLKGLPISNLNIINNHISEQDAIELLKKYPHLRLNIPALNNHISEQDAIELLKKYPLLSKISTLDCISEKNAIELLD